ncbi:MAG: hypothetical protein ACRERU_07790 [Methylococcales bacterium]
MKLFNAALLGIATALVSGIYLMYVADPGSIRNTTMAARLPTSTEAADALEPQANRKADGVPVVVSGDGLANGMKRDIAALRDEVAQLRAAVFALQQAGVRALKQSSAGVGVEADPAKNYRRDPDTRAEADQLRQQQMAESEAAFQREPTDNEWALQTTANLQEAIAKNEAIQSAVRDTVCHSRTCRVEVIDDTGGKLASSMIEFMQQVADSLPSVTINQTEDGNGLTTTILYLSQDSDEPPQDDP